MDEERLVVEFKVTNSQGKVTASMTLGEMKEKEVVNLEVMLLEALKKRALEQL